MRFYLRSEKQAAKMLYKRGNENDRAKYDEIYSHNQYIMRMIYNGLMNETISGAQIKNGDWLNVYTKSLRGNYIQTSYFVKLNGEYKAVGHTDVTEFPLIMENLQTGNYIVTD